MTAGPRRRRRSLLPPGEERSLRRSKIAISALVTLAAALLLAASAEGRLTFPPAQTLSAAGDDARGPRMAIDSQDRATVVWSISPGVIQSVRLGADGSTETIRNLGIGSSPELAIDPQGRATVVWEQSRPVGPMAIQWVRIGADGNPGEAQTLADGSNPQVAVDAQGRATVVWQAFVGLAISERIQARRLGADGTPGAVHTLSGESQPAVRPEVAVDRQGRATVVWGGDAEGTTVSRNQKVQAVRLGADGTPGVVHTLSRAGAWRAALPQVEVDSKGQATVVWGQRAGRINRVREVLIQAVRLGADGNPGAVHRLSKRSPGGARLALDPRGRATVVWQRVARAKSRIQSVRIGARGTPRKLRTLSKAKAFRPRVAVDSMGRATVVWERGWRRAAGIQARRLGAKGVPGALHTLSRARGRVSDAQVAIDSKGLPAVAWQRSEGAKHRIDSTRGQDRR